MDNDASVLIVDANRAFCCMFQEGLEQAGGYRVRIAASGDEAIQALAADEFDLAVVDLGLTEPDGATVARSLRQAQVDLPLMLIPLEGDVLPSELVDLDVQGVLPKPFFLPELPGRIARAREQSVRAAPGAMEVAESDRPPAPTPEVPQLDPDVVRAMTALAQDIHAEAVILTRGNGLIARVGQLSDEDAGELAQAVAENWRTSTRVAQILGREQLRFEQSVEGGEYMFYSLAIAEDVILSMALQADVPLGMIRQKAKAVANALRGLIGGVR